MSGSCHPCVVYHLPKHRCRPWTPFHRNVISWYLWLLSAKMVQGWFEKHNSEFEVLTWSSNSPDLNPVEHLWKMETPTHSLLLDLKDVWLTFRCRYHSTASGVSNGVHTLTGQGCFGCKTGANTILDSYDVMRSDHCLILKTSDSQNCGTFLPMKVLAMSHNEAHYPLHVNEGPEPIAAVVGWIAG